jgi:hypothetical protein
LIGQLVTRFATGLRFPTLFALVATLFVVDLLVPDLIPFVDEVMLALGTLLVAAFRKRRGTTATTATAPTLPGDGGRGKA